MSDYTNSYGGAAKDAANATILGADVDTELDAIATMSGTKANKIGSPTAGNLVTVTGTGDIADSGSSIVAIQQVTYPVGTIFTSVLATDPNTLLGFGTWARIAEGRVLVSEGTGAGLTARVAATEIGTEDTIVPAHTHAITDPGHIHTYNTSASSTGAGGASGAITGTANTSSNTTGVTVDSEGVSPTDTNLQPSLVVYMWERTA